MIEDNAYMQNFKNFKEEDELSTSFGGSDSEVTHTSEDELRPPPGLSLPKLEAKGWSFGNQIVRPPPGLSLEEDSEQEEHSLSIEVVGPPPGLSLRATPPVTPPPGFEAFCPPPGIFFDDASTKQQALPTRRTRGRKKNNASVSENAKLPSPPLQPAPAASEKAMAPPAPLVPREFEQAAYRKELSDVLRELASYNNVAASVKRIRLQNVPRERQAPEFRDILTRAAEENRGVARRLSFAFAAGLAAGAQSAFAREECLNGIQLFFEDVFEELASEVPRLRNKLANELVPTLRTVFSEEEVSRLVPPDCRTVVC